MKRTYIIFLVLVSMLGCSADPISAGPTGAGTNDSTDTTNNNGDIEVLDITVTSESWTQDATIDPMYVRENVGGQNVSPQVSWSAIDGAQWYLVVVVDHHPVANDWIHWVVLVPDGFTSIDEGTSGSLPEGMVEYENSFGNAGYDGPAPPPGDAHDYHLVVMALLSRPELPQRPSWADILAAVDKPLMGQGELVAYFGTDEEN